VIQFFLRILRETIACCHRDPPPSGRPTGPLPQCCLPPLILPPRSRPPIGMTVGGKGGSRSCFKHRKQRRSGDHPSGIDGGGNPYRSVFSEVGLPVGASGVAHHVLFCSIRELGFTSSFCRVDYTERVPSTVSSPICPTSPFLRSQLVVVIFRSSQPRRWPRGGW